MTRSSRSGTAGSFYLNTSEKARAFKHEMNRFRHSNASNDQMLPKDIFALELLFGLVYNIRDER